MGARQQSHRPHSPGETRVGSELDKRPRGEATRSHYTAEEIELGLTEVAHCLGNTRRAAKSLEGQRMKIPRSTLRYWKDTLHRDRFLAIWKQELPRIQQRIAQRSEELADAEADLEWDAIDRVREELRNMSPKDAAGALRNIATARGISVDKARVSRGDPTQVVEHRRSPEEILRKLVAKGIVVLEGEAEELPSVHAEVVPGESGEDDEPKGLDGGGKESAGNGDVDEEPAAQA